MNQTKLEKMSESHFLIYQTDDGKTQIEALLENDSVWLTQVQMAELFQKGRSTITEHIKNLFDEDELVEHSVSRKYRLTAFQICPNHKVLI